MGGGVIKEDFVDKQNISRKLVFTIFQLNWGINP